MFFLWKSETQFSVYFVPLRQVGRAKRRGWINLSSLTLPPAGGLGDFYMHDAVPKVVRIAVSTVMMMLRILPQVVLLLNVPIVYSVLIIHCKYSILH